MPEHPQRELTPKGEQTKERILDAALALFTAQGYEETTLRAIAKAAGCSLGLTYRYFSSKEDLVLLLYLQLAQRLAAQVEDLPPGPLAQRFTAALRAKLALVAPYRDALGALFSSALNPRSPIAVLGSQTSEVRRTVSQVFAAMVAGATDAPSEPAATQLAGVLYITHLVCLLFWMHDRSPAAQATDSLLALLSTGLSQASPLLALPAVEDALGRLSATLEPVFGASSTHPSLKELDHGHDPR